VFKGDDKISKFKKYGAHIMFHTSKNEKSICRISNLELKQAGQASQLGRYPIHFHMLGSAPNSYIKGCSIYNTYNRALGIHGVNHLKVQNNVAYNIYGHGIFIEDAIETNNELSNNLVIQTMSSWSLLSTDQSPASFWITHPNNNLIGNHAAGSEKYGFYYDLQTNPTGPSYTTDICPQFEKLGTFANNTAHSNEEYGLRIHERFIPVENSCLAASTAGTFEQPDETTNPPIEAHFYNFTTFKNKITGVVADEVGALRFHNIAIADNKASGIEFGTVSSGPWINETQNYHLQDSLIIGLSNNYEDAQKTETDTIGLNGPRTEKFKLK
jgi:hypothetical protein